jgi:RNA polymerase sigma factor (sigma-70 family)
MVMPEGVAVLGSNEEAKLEWLRRLLREFEGRLLRYAVRFVKIEVARELVQETFARIWKEDPSALKNREREWLFCVCRNLALDYLKKERPLSYVTQDNAIEPLAESALSQNESMGEVNGILRALPASQQEVIRLKFQESMSYQEISEVTGHSVSHVGVLIHEAMKEVRRKMKISAKGAL